MSLFLLLFVLGIPQFRLEYEWDTFEKLGKISNETCLHIFHTLSQKHINMAQYSQNDPTFALQ